MIENSEISSEDDDKVYIGDVELIGPGDVVIDSVPIYIEPETEDSMNQDAVAPITGKSMVGSTEKFRRNFDQIFSNSEAGAGNN